MDTSEHYSPWDQLPVPEPAKDRPPIDHFYQETSKHLVRDVVRIMNNGIPINLERVKELEDVLDTLLAQVADTLANNRIINSYLIQRHKRQVAEYISDQQSKMKPPSHFLKPFNFKDMSHRSYFMHIYANDQGIAPPTDTLPTGISKWPANTAKKLAASRPLLQRFLEGKLPESNSYVQQALLLWSTHKAEIYNRQYVDNIATCKNGTNTKIELPEFNPSSPDQKHDIFVDILGFESNKLTDAYIAYERACDDAVRYNRPMPSPPRNKFSWDRDNVEDILRSTDDPEIAELCQALIDHSFGAIVKNNFVQAFYNYTVDGRLHGSLSLFGAKTFRLTSKNPNLLNAPSSKSIYSKPVKRCFVAPPGYVILTADFSALEDRVMASLSRDTNKCNIFLQDLDGHCLNAYGYFKSEIANYMPLTGDTVTDVKEFRRLQDEEKHPQLDKIRSKGKPATFGLAYGSYPPKVAKTLKIPLPEAEQIFNSYHNELYTGITKYRDDYVLPTAEAEGQLHLGMGCYIKTDNPRRDIRTLANSTCQFWSILTLLSINKMHQLIDEAGLQDDVVCISTIYDSIYYIVREDAAIIKWTNDNLINCMLKPYIDDQTIRNEAASDIGLDWASLHQIPNNATEAQIAAVLETIHDKD